MSETTVNTTVVARAEYSVMGSDLVSHLKVAANAWDKNASLPILKHVMFTLTDPEALILEATDLEYAVVRTVAARQDYSTFEHGMCLPFAALMDVLPKMFNADRIDITFEHQKEGRTKPELRPDFEWKSYSVPKPEDYIQVPYTVDRCVATFQQGDTEWELAGMSAEDFPFIPRMGKLKGGVEAELLLFQWDAKEGPIGFIEAGAASEDNRPILQGVLLKLDAESKTALMASADGYRLHLLEMPAPVIHDASLIIPARAFKKFVGKRIEDQLLNVYLAGEQVIFNEGPHTTVISLIEGKFPDYEAIIPRNFSGVITVPINEAFAAFTKIGAIASQSASTTRIHDMQDDSFVVSAKSETRGKGQRTVKNCVINSDVDEVALNYSYMVDAFKQIAALYGQGKPKQIEKLSKRCNIHLVAPTAPVVIQPEDLAGMEATVVVMPMSTDR